MSLISYNYEIFNYTDGFINIPLDSVFYRGISIDNIDPLKKAATVDIFYVIVS